VFTPDGDHAAFVQLKPGIEDRLRQLDVLRKFMIYKAAAGFVMVTELGSPASIFVVAVTRARTLGAIRGIRRKPVRFGKIEWLPAELIDDSIAALLPPKIVAVSKDDLAFMKEVDETGSIEGIKWQRLTKSLR
jgi:hypothetical protein